MRRRGFLAFVPFAAALAPKVAEGDFAAMMETYWPFHSRVGAGGALAEKMLRDACDMTWGKPMYEQDVLYTADGRKLTRGMTVECDVDRLFEPFQNQGPLFSELEDPE